MAFKLKFARQYVDDSEYLRGNKVVNLHVINNFYWMISFKHMINTKKKFFFMHAYFVDSCKNIGETLFNRMEQLNLFLKVSECFCEVTIISRHSSLFVSTGNRN